MGQHSSHQAELQPEDEIFLTGLQPYSKIQPLSGVTSPPHLARPEVGMGNQAAPLLTRLLGSQQRSGHQGSSGHSQVTADRAGYQSLA